MDAAYGNCWQPSPLQVDEFLAELKRVHLLMWQMAALTWSPPVRAVDTFNAISEAYQQNAVKIPSGAAVEQMLHVFETREERLGNMLFHKAATDKNAYSFTLLKQCYKDMDASATVAQLQRQAQQKDMIYAEHQQQLKHKQQ